MNLSNIISEIQSFNTSDPLSKKNEFKSDKEYRGNQHELDTYLNTIKYMEYKKNIRKNVKQTKGVSSENTFDNNDAVQKYFEESQYKRKWSRLDMFLKKKKIDEYIQNKVKENIINESDIKKYKQLLYTKLYEKKLNTKKDLVYDEKVGTIIDIPYFNKILSTN